MINPLNWVNPKDDGEALRSLKKIFDELTKLKNEEMDLPTDDRSEESMKWYTQYAIEKYEEMTRASQFDQKVKRQLLYNSMTDYFTSQKRSGSMYTFMYQPETEDMRYWDKYPLVMRILDNSDSTESFLGINLHYLQPKFRWQLMVSLMSRLNGVVESENSRIVGLGMNRIRLPQNRYGRVCIRRYKYDNIRGRMLRIPPEHWLKIIFLPTYHFVGAKPQKVWQDSYRNIRKLGYGDK